MTATVAMSLTETPILPWSKTIALLLSSLNIEELQTLVYRWAQPDDIDIIYLNTPWHALGVTSPCLVRVHRAIDPAFQQFLTHRNEPWGCVLVSDGGWDALVAHMRWLISVKMPTGQLVLRNATDATLNHGLFLHAEHTKDARLFGPCQQIVTADVLDDVWQTCTRPGPAPVADYQSPYALSDEQWQRCEGLEEHRQRAQLFGHLRAFFPQHAGVTYAGILVQQAREQGLLTERTLLQYANACARLIGQAPLSSELKQLLHPQRPQTLSDTVERLAALTAQLPQRILP